MLTSLFSTRSIRQQDFLPNPGLEPNSVQLEFLSLLGKHYYHVGLGDACHAQILPKIFSLNLKTVQTMARAGKTRYHTELGPQGQIYFDSVGPAARSNYSLAEKAQIHFVKNAYFWAFWSGLENRRRLFETFEQSAAQTPEMKFTAADMRFASTLSALKTFSLLPVSAVNTLCTLGAKSFAYLRDGIISDRAHERVERFMLTGGAAGPLSNDRETAEYIASFHEPSVIFYGEGHFRNSHESPATSLLSVLKENSQSICLISVLEKPGQDAMSAFINKVNDISPDARLYVFPHKETPHGIEILDPELEPLYRQAILNCESKGGSPEPAV